MTLDFSNEFETIENKIQTKDNTLSQNIHKQANLWQ